jgi:alpha-beta hydrolase superfamily lysophospholipase
MLQTDFNFEFNTSNYHYSKWIKEENNTIVIIIHGLGEHIGRYEGWVMRFNAFNYGVCGVDLYGHGLSTGKRGHMKSIDDTLDMLNFFIERIQNEYSTKKIVLYGHSMGGNILAQLLLKRHIQVQAAIFSSPWFGLIEKPSFFQYNLAKLMYQIYPSYSEKAPLDPNKISTEPEEVSKYVNDPLVHNYVTPGLFIPLYKATDFIIENSKKLKLPTLVFHSIDDQITDYNASEKFANSNSKIKLKLFEKVRHEIHHDFLKEDLLNYLLDWLSANVKYR